jgi:hypothetical protein
MLSTENTSFTKDVQGRYLCNTFDEARATDFTRFDVVVIGGGSFGAMVAEQIFGLDSVRSRRRHRILVLEAGLLLLPEHVQNLPPMGLKGPSATTIEAMRQEWLQKFGPPVPKLLDRSRLDSDAGLEAWGLPWHARVGQNATDPKDKKFPGLAYCLAGRSLFWGGWSPALIDTELADWPSDVAADLKSRDFSEAAAQLGTDITNDFIHGPLHTALRNSLQAGISSIPGALPVSDPAQLEAPLAVQSSGPRSGFFPFNKFSSLPLLFAAARQAEGEASGNDGAKRLMVVPGCHVIRLHLDRNRAVNRIETTDGDVPVLPTSIVIIALGTIESTRLALSSFPNSNGLMGKNLMAHLRSNTTIRFPRAALGPGLPDELEASALFLKGRTASGHFHLQITACGVRGDVRDSEAELFKKVPDVDQLALLKVALQSIPDDFIVVTLRGIGEMEPQRSVGAIRRVDLDPETDENAAQRAIVTMAVTSKDQTLWNDMDAAAVKTAEALASGSVAELRYLNESNGQWQTAPWIRRDGLGTTHHEGGTLWMGTTPMDSVTNSFGRFHDVPNAFAVGPAIFPSVGSPNPMLGGTALLRRTARMLIPPDPAPVLEPGFSSLFDGSTLAGWRMAGPGQFILEPRDHGVMVSEGGLGLLWYSVKSFANFILRMEWQATRPDDNSGVFIRFPDPGQDPFVAVREGYEIQIDGRGRTPQGGFDDPLYMTGAVYGLAPARMLASRLTGEWNQLEIEASAAQLSVRLNGELVVDRFTDSRRLNGFVGVQNHGGGSRVAFRHIRIQET